MTYRVGSHYGIHVYEVAAGDGPEEDRPVATASTPEDAERIVHALNGMIRWTALVAAGPAIDEGPR